MKKIIFVLGLFLILFFNSNVYAACDSADINRLKEIANNVLVTYEHNVYESLEEDNGVSYVSIYDIIVSGINNEIYVVDGDGNKYNSYDGSGSIYISTSSGKRKVDIYSSVCSGTKLRTVTLDLPYFNFNSMSEECQKPEFSDLDVCSKFLLEDDKVIGSEEFDKIIREEKEKQGTVLYKIIDFVVNNVWYVVGGALIVLVILIILLVRHHKRSVLE